jgi:hypothetical protein
MDINKITEITENAAYGISIKAVQNGNASTLRITDTVTGDLMVFSLDAAETTAKAMLSVLTELKKQT